MQLFFRDPSAVNSLPPKKANNKIYMLHVYTTQIPTADKYLEALSVEVDSLYVSTMYVAEEVAFGLVVGRQPDHVVHPHCVLDRSARWIRVWEHVRRVDAGNLRVREERVVVCEEATVKDAESIRLYYNMSVYICAFVIYYSWHITFHVQN